MSEGKDVAPIKEEDNKPDLKQIGLEVAENSLQEFTKKALKPYAMYYADKYKDTPFVGPMIKEMVLKFVDEFEADLLKKLDKIDGKIGV